MKIVVGKEISESQVAAWREQFAAAEFTSVATPGAATMADADAYIGRIGRDTYMAAGPRLRWVHSNGAGIETVTAIPELVASEVIVTNTRGGHAPCIAEHTFALLLALTRRIVPLAEDQRNHLWKGPGRNGPLRELSGATICILGFGNIGRSIARRAAAFDMQIRAIDPQPGAVPEGVESVWGPERLDEALAGADVLVVAVPDTPETRGLIDARRIALLAPQSFLLAVSRGGIVDEVALAAALYDGHLAGAGLDVLASEPPAHDDPLWDTPNLLLTPHCSGASSQTRERVGAITTENVRRFVAGEQLLNICDKRAGY